MIETLTRFGFSMRDAQSIIQAAHSNGLTEADIEAWIDHASNSNSIHNPQGFVRSRITAGAKPPRNTHATHHIDPDKQPRGSEIARYWLCLGWIRCPRCKQSPCICRLPRERQALTKAILRRITERMQW